MVHDPTFAFQNHTNPPVAKPAAFMRDRVHHGTYFRIVRRVFTPNGLGVDTNKTAGSVLRDVVIPHCSERCRSPLGRCRQIFPSRSFSTTLSKMASANKRFSLAFSSVTARA
jgi:hypothetical protein